MPRNKNSLQAGQVQIRLVAKTKAELETAVAELNRAHGAIIDWSYMPQFPGRDGEWLRYGKLNLMQLAQKEKTDT